MKISVNDEELYTLSELHEQVIKNDINADIFQEDMGRRLEWVLRNKYEECFRRLKVEWDPKLTSAGITSIPTDADEYATLVFSQATYKDRKARDQE